jgi:hypothetical protein
MNTHIFVMLRKHDRIQYAWIPTKLADKGSYRKILSEDGWKVEEVYKDTQIESKWVNERSQDYKKMRSVTDI